VPTGYFGYGPTQVVAEPAPSFGALPRAVSGGAALLLGALVLAFWLLHRARRDPVTAGPAELVVFEPAAAFTPESAREFTPEPGQWELDPGLNLAPPPYQAPPDQAPPVYWAPPAPPTAPTPPTPPVPPSTTLDE
jgi:hypothetical protein